MTAAFVVVDISLHCSSPALGSRLIQNTAGASYDDIAFNDEIKPPFLIELSHLSEVNLSENNHHAKNKL